MSATTQTTHPLAEPDRRRLTSALWLMVGAAVLALVGIFGFGGLTGAGDYFDDATHDAALRDFYWQIWGIMLPIAVATVISGIALTSMAGVLARTGSGWSATVLGVARRVVLPATVLSSVPYWFGPEFDGAGLPSWAQATFGIAGLVAYGVVAGMGVAMLGLPVPRWTGIALVLGALAAVVTYLPLFVFVGSLASGVGVLRWRRRSEAPAGV